MRSRAWPATNKTNKCKLSFVTVRFWAYYTLQCCDWVRNWMSTRGRRSDGFQEGRRAKAKGTWSCSHSVWEARRGVSESPTAPAPRTWASSARLRDKCRQHRAANEKHEKPYIKKRLLSIKCHFRLKIIVILPCELQSNQVASRKTWCCSRHSHHRYSPTTLRVWTLM